MNVSEQEIKERIMRLEIEIKPLHVELAELKKRLLEMKSPFQVGDVISWNEGKRRGRVLEIRLWCCDEPCWKVRCIRKNGSEGSTEMVRSYNKPEKVQE